MFGRPPSGKDDSDELRRLFADHEIRSVEADSAEAEAHAAANRRPAFVGVAGGDGTIRTVASQLVETGVPLLTVPTGTRNHFSRALGIATMHDAAVAAQSASTCNVDVGTVNDVFFVNNASVGVYPELVRRREHLEDRWPKTVATLLAAWSQATRLTRMPISIDDDHATAWMLFVGNGCYGTSVFQATDRERLAQSARRR